MTDKDGSMIYLIGIAGIIILVVMVIVINNIKERIRLKKAYGKFDCLFTKAELKFYSVLSKICYELDVELFAKVRLADLVKVVNKKDYMSYFGRIKAKHIDYVICHRKTLEPMICIELDDSSHNMKSRVERDQFVDTVLTNVGYKIIRIKVSYHYDKEHVKYKILNAIKDYRRVS